MAYRPALEFLLYDWLHVEQLANAVPYMQDELPKIGAWLQVAASRDPTCAQMPEAAF